MSILFCMALLAAAADDSVDLSNPFIGDNVSDAVAMDEFTVEPATKSSAEETAEVTYPPEFDLPFECGSQKVQVWTSADLPQPMNSIRPKPEWLGQPLVKTGDVHSIAASSPPMLTEIEAREQLDKAILTAVREYVDDQVGRVGAGRRVNITMDDVDSCGMETDRYMQDHEARVGPMKIAHAHLQFRPNFREEIAKRWKEHVVTARLMRTGLTVAGVMVLLIMAFGFLKSASK